MTLETNSTNPYAHDVYLLKHVSDCGGGVVEATPIFLSKTDGAREIRCLRKWQIVQSENDQNMQFGRQTTKI
jgi:hypothetical protein